MAYPWAAMTNAAHDNGGQVQHLQFRGVGLVGDDPVRFPCPHMGQSLFGSERGKVGRRLLVKDPRLMALHIFDDAPQKSAFVFTRRGDQQDHLSQRFPIPLLGFPLHGHSGNQVEVTCGNA